MQLVDMRGQHYEKTELVDDGRGWRHSWPRLAVLHTATGFSNSEHHTPHCLASTVHPQFYTRTRQSVQEGVRN